jgi:resuscitation-promoting factor RpfA
MTSRPDSRKGRSLLRLVVTGAVAVAAPFALAGTANAAPDSAWEKLARCESGGNWKIDTGNGYYGGLQFTPRTWRAFGGKGMPHEASKAQQIAVAERVLEAQGWNAWPSCSRKMALRSHVAEPHRVRASAPAELQEPNDSPASRSTMKNGADYTIADGDTLALIADSHDVPGGWKALYERNRDVLSSPHALRVGQQLDLR